MKRYRVLLVVPEGRTMGRLTKRLVQFGVSVRACPDEERARELFRVWHPEVVVVESHLPRCDGLDFCRLLRVERYSGFVLVYSTHDAPIDVISALAAGADDHLSHSADAAVFDAKLRRALQRRRTCLQCQAAREDARAEPATVSESPLPLEPYNLTRLEKQLLTRLVASGSSLTSSETLLYSGWGKGDICAKLLYDVISRLRRKLEPLGWEIHNIRGRGYRLDRVTPRLVGREEGSETPVYLLG